MGRKLGKLSKYHGSERLVREGVPQGQVKHEGFVRKKRMEGRGEKKSACKAKIKEILIKRKKHSGKRRK